VTYKVKNLEIPNDIRSLEAEINAFFEKSDLEVVGVLHSDKRYDERKGRTMLRITLLLRERYTLPPGSLAGL
jgi:hypothetical protein